MKVKAIKAFTDLEAKIDRAVGDVWEVSQARKDALDASEYAPLVEVVQTPTRAKQTPKKATKSQTKAKTAE